MNENDRTKYFHGKLLTEKDFKNEQEYIHSKRGDKKDMNGDTFYDIHMHAFNLSHPNLLAFINRLGMGKLLFYNSIIAPLFNIPGIGGWLKGYANKKLISIKNLLSVMENDMGSFFLLMENYLRDPKYSLLDKDGLHIGGSTYSRIVLTPLMMDFGYMDMKTEGIYYDIQPQKPIVEQVVDVFNGIKKYKEAKSSKELMEKFPNLEPGTDRVFEIYPFLGLNTKNYKLEKLKVMLDKYFKDYKGIRGDLYANMGKFDNDIEKMTGNFFAGIKVYPPLGFDPWPEKDPVEENKVRYLYQYCCDKEIPITAHGSGGGFVVVGEKVLKDYTSISKWGKVLKEYPKLQLNLAHFPMKERCFKFFPDPRHKRLKAMIELVLNNENVYVDFSCRATNVKYYQKLRNEINKLSDEQKEKIMSRILFGSDFTVNLMSIESYNHYLNVFSSNGHFSQEEKKSFCSINPEEFLFTKPRTNA